jgi:hypothetical protein
VIKWAWPGVVIGGALTRGPDQLVLILAVVTVVVVLATYLLIAKKGVAPRIEWGKLKISFARLPDRKK